VVYYVEFSGGVYRSGLAVKSLAYSLMCVCMFVCVCVCVLQSISGGIGFGIVSVMNRV
jgi:hypothetical protein